VSEDGPLRVAVVTGGHAFDVVSFTDMFRDLEGIRAYVQHMDDFVGSKRDLRDRYEVILFYTMLREGPEDALRAVLSRPTERGQGIVMLHHAVLAYPDWVFWDDLVGIVNRHVDDSFQYHHDQRLSMHVADPDHPITAGIADWDLIDETYVMNEPGPQSHLLLATEHPRSMKAIAWTRSSGKSRVFCHQGGHDEQAFADLGFRRLLRAGIFWTAGRT
jgi:type 1 glutamine amidotransferase